MVPEEILLEKSGWHYNFQMSANLSKEGLATTKSHKFTHETLCLALSISTEIKFSSCYIPSKM